MSKSRPAGEARRFRDELLRAQLRPVLGLALAVAFVSVLLVLGQYASLRLHHSDPLKDIPIDEVRAVFSDARPSQIPTLVRWLVTFGLHQELEGDEHVRLLSGERIPIRLFVQLVDKGVCIDPMTSRPIGSAPLDWLEKTQANGYSRVTPKHPNAGDEWYALAIRIGDDRLIVIQAPERDLPSSHLLEVMGFISLGAFLFTGSFVGLFLWSFRNRFAASSAAQLALPIERISDALSRFAEDQTSPIAIPVQPPLELARLAHSANLVQQSLSESLRRLAKASEDQQKLFAEISHELRTPLTVIRGHAELLERAFPDQGSAAIIVRQVEDLHRLLGDMIELARMGSISSSMACEVLLVGPFLQEVKARFHASAWRSGILIRLEDVSPDLSVKTDPLWLRQVMANLLSNAIRHTPCGGWISLSANLEAGSVCIRIVDSGPGIEATESSAAIVDRGAGIGLRVVRRLLTSMGGELRVGSGDEGGAQLDAVLPASVDPCHPRIAPPDSQAQARG